MEQGSMELQGAPEDFVQKSDFFRTLTVAKYAEPLSLLSHPQAVDDIIPDEEDPEDEEDKIFRDSVLRRAGVQDRFGCFLDPLSSSSSTSSSSSSSAFTSFPSSGSSLHYDLSDVPDINELTNLQAALSLKNRGQDNGKGNLEDLPALEDDDVNEENVLDDSSLFSQSSDPRSLTYTPHHVLSLRQNSSSSSSSLVSKVSRLSIADQDETGTDLRPEHAPANSFSASSSTPAFRSRPAKARPLRSD